MGARDVAFRGRISFSGRAAPTFAWRGQGLGNAWVVASPDGSGLAEGTRHLDQSDDVVVERLELLGRHPPFGVARRADHVRRVTRHERELLRPGRAPERDGWKSWSA